MKKICHPAILFALCAALPVMSVLTFLLGLTLEVKHSTACIVVLSVESVFVTVLSLWNKDRIYNTSDTVFSILSLITSVVNWLWYMSFVDHYWLTVVLAVPFLCAVILCSVRIKHKVLRILNIGGSIVFVVVFVQITVFLWLIAHIGTTTVIKEISSPDGTFVVHVIDADHGTFGGDTFVKVYDSRFSLDMGFIEIYKTPDTVYKGEWSEWKNMSVTWKDENTLVIDGKEYAVD